MRRALGKGLSQLIGEQADASPSEVAVSSIRPNRDQPRTVFDDAAIKELAASIREAGILQPLIVRALAEGTYELIAGERRLRAAKLAGLDMVPVIVRSAGRQDSLELALIENLQREDISPLECARAYRRLSEEFGLTQEQIAEKVGKGRVSVANTLRLLKLPPRVLEGLESEQITEGHARAILSAEGPALQLALFDKIVSQGLTVRGAEEASRPSQRASAPRGKKAKRQDPHLRAIESALSEKLGSVVKVSASSGGGGTISVPYYSDDDLERILEALGVRL